MKKEVIERLQSTLRRKANSPQTEATTLDISVNSTHTARLMFPSLVVSQAKEKGRAETLTDRDEVKLFEISIMNQLFIKTIISLVMVSEKNNIN